MPLTNDIALAYTRSGTAPAAVQAAASSRGDAQVPRSAAGSSFPIVQSGFHLSTAGLVLVAALGLILLHRAGFKFNLAVGR